MARGQAVGGLGSCRVWKGLTPHFRVCALPGAQMVVVNSSSPMAAGSGPWDARGMEESVTASDGNAESLYMQGTVRGGGSSGSPGVGRREMAPGAQARPRTLLPLLLCTRPLPTPNPPFSGFHPPLDRAQPLGANLIRTRACKPIKKVVRALAGWCSGTERAPHTRRWRVGFPGRAHA